jgi:hypothetical protein
MNRLVVGPVGRCTSEFVGLVTNSLTQLAKSVNRLTGAFINDLDL